jgi:predicted metal-dependent enzyme (double-stranded beta helix superfamily)
MFDIDRFVADCRAALGEPTPELAMREILERAVSRPSDLEAALGTPRRGEIAALHHAPDLTILNVVWTPCMSINPHNHRMWAAIGLYGGREDNTFHRRSPEGLSLAGRREVGTGEVLLLGHDVIHSVENPLRSYAGAIHIYGGDLFAPGRSEWIPGLAGEQPFDVERARRVMAEANERWESAQPLRT